MLNMLNRKLFRDFARMLGQVLAIALVMASGVATLVLAVGAYRSLDETRAAYYERYWFADIFASAKRAPEHLIGRISHIPGVAAADPRISKFALLDIEGMVNPATGMVRSVPDYGELVLNRLYLRSGRLPEPGRVDEVTVNESFAKAHKFDIGSTFKAILNGRKRTLRIVGIALSPEFIYALGPGDFIPDDTRFGVLWMSQKALESIFDLEGAFNSVTVKLQRNASEPEVIRQLDELLDPYGGTGAYARKDQQSHAFLDGELQGLDGMSRVIPPIFLLVSAFMINMTLTRLIALEREQIGLLKALGYGRWRIAAHYLKMSIVIAAVGIAIGFVAGTWLGHGLTLMYAEFYHFPFLIFYRGWDVYVISAAIAALAATVGAAKAVYSVVKLPPAVAMAPPAPTQYAHIGIERLAVFKVYTQLTMMALRHMIRWPVRTSFTILGVALSVSLLVTSFFMIDSVEFMIDATFFQSDRQDATVTFTDERPVRVLQEVERLPGVLRAEPVRNAHVRLRHGHLHRRLAIQGKAPGTDLSRVLDLDLEPVVLADSGLILGERVADLLDARVGDEVEVEVLEGKRVKRTLPVSQIIQSYLGLSAFMELDALNEMLDESPLITSVHVAYDTAMLEDLFKTIKGLPAVSAIASQRAALAKFRETLAQNIYIMTAVYISLSVIISFGVVYNSARIQLSERAREFASLRVLGFTKGEVSRVMLTELAILILIAIPLGCVIGYGFAKLVIVSFESDIYRIPFLISSQTYAFSSLVVMTAAVVSALIVRRRIDRLDLIKALKTRE